MAGGYKLMVEYPDLSSLSNNSGIEDLMALPNASFPWFWVTILAGIFLILTLSLYYREKEERARGSLLSAAAVSSLACIVLAVIGSLFGLFTLETLVPVIVFGILIIAVWFMSARSRM